MLHRAEPGDRQEARRGTEGASGRFKEEKTVANAWCPDREGAWKDPGSEFIAVVLIQAPLFTET